MPLLSKLITKVCILWYQLIGKDNFKSFGNNVLIMRPLRIDGAKNISISNGVHINYKTWLAALPLTGPHCELTIGQGTVIGNFNHIYATKKIFIGKKVLTADKVYISDNLHEYENIHLPVMEQPVRQIGEVSIGDGTWIGENVVILGAKIGCNCVIGANAVITHDVPDYCVVVGIPGRIIKRYHLELNKWIRTGPDGTYLNT